MNVNKIREMSVIAITGPTVGKTVMRKALHSVLKSSRLGSAPDPIIESHEMSDIIRWGHKRGDAISRDIQRYLPLQATGRFIPDSVMEPLFFEWLDANYVKVRNHPAKTLIIAGLPRTEKQGTWRSAFSSFRTYHLRASKEQTILALKERVKTSRDRVDDINPAAIDNKWDEYTNQVIPALKSLHGTVVDVDRSKPLRDRLSLILTDLKSISNSPISRCRATRALHRLNNPSCGHEIHQLIESIERPRTIQISPVNN